MTSKEEIIKVSAVLIREKGYAGVSMRDIAKTIGVKASSLYNHIPSKQAILTELILDIAKLFTTQIKAIENEDDSTVFKLQKIIAQHVEISLSFPNQLAVLNNEWVHLEGNELVKFKEMRHQYETLFRQIIDNGKANKELKPIHTELILFSMLSTLRNLNLWIKKRGGIPANQLKTELSEVLLKGIASF